jgi:phospholipid-translocating ATPase
MAAPHQYHQPNAPDDDDLDSDLELGLDELDPLAGRSTSTSPAPTKPYHELGARIPLRNLRVGRLRANRPPPVQDDSTHSDGSFGQSGDEDQALLLPQNSERPRKPSALSRLHQTVRLPSFLSASRPDRQPIQLDDEAEEEHDPSTQRTIAVGQPMTQRFPANAVSNAKYTPWSFLPRTLYNEFSFFINMYFLLVALSQFIPPLKIGYFSTYIVPLAFVLTVTLGKEAFDDIARRRRDHEANSEPYTVLRFEENDSGSGLAPGPKSTKKRKLRKNGGRTTDIEDEEEQINTTKGLATASYWELTKPSRGLKVGDVVKLGKDQRVPADMIILKSYSAEATADMSIQASDAGSSGEAFIRTDQLDGETDWKLRLTSPLTQNLDVAEYTRLRVTAGKPDKKVNEFYGTVELQARKQRQYDPHDEISPQNQESQSSPLGIDNTIWANTVLASSCNVLAVVVYTGPQTRQALSTSASRSKTGLLELEINALTKFLCIFTLSLSFVLVALNRFQDIAGQKWYVSMMRFLILFSTIVPVGLRVNLDMGKSVYAWFIEHDKSIQGTVVRTSTIPEDLGRVEYLLSDKTGTLTQNGKSPSSQVARVWGPLYIVKSARQGVPEIFSRVLNRIYR